MKKHVKFLNDFRLIIYFRYIGLNDILPVYLINNINFTGKI